MKAKASLRAKKLGLPAAVFACSFCFIAGLFTSYVLFLQDIVPAGRPRPRQLQEEEIGGYDLLTRGETGDDFVTLIPFQVLSWKPRALYFPKFATPEQCKGVIEMARPSLKPSTLALRKGETEENTAGIRTSSGMFISASEDKTGVLDAIEEKIARATMLPRSHGEVASFLLYLSDVEEGGETMFPLENSPDLDENYDFQKCMGLKVKPRQGDGLLFYSLLPNNTIDPTSLHGSCPVIRGNKWVATKWIRDQDQTSE